MTVVDARFAGGSINVEPDDEYTGGGTPGVLIEIPGANAVWLFQHEARDLARVLLDAADGFSPEKRLRRRRDVDLDLIGIDE